MEKKPCLGIIEGNKYSSPMPVIGVYIMAATLVCLFLLILDVLKGYRRRKLWLPCRFFSLNSLTLTLLGVATKLPVDLTTSMPSAQDQLSKLCGSSLICIFMGLFMPSLVTMRGSELLANMASLTILVVTVIVNICIQMVTGVIFSTFIVEHVITLTLMLLVLIAMWYFTFNIGFLTELVSDGWREKLNEDYSGSASSKTQTLGDYYVHSYVSNPQLRVCRAAHYSTIGMLCTLPLLVLLEIAVRTFFLKELRFCKGVSDYEWSMWMVVVTQILTLLIGAIIITLRVFFLASQHDPFNTDETKMFSIRSVLHGAQFRKFEVLAKLILDWKVYSLPLLFSSKWIIKVIQVLEDLVIYILFVLEMIISWMDRVVMFLPWIIRKCFAWSRGNADETSRKYLYDKGREELEKWTQEYEKDKPHHLIQLLLKTHPSGVSRGQENCNNCLLLVTLVRMATVIIPSDSWEPLARALDEAFDIIYFIDQRMESLSFFNNYRRRLAKDLWKGRSINSHWFQKKVIIPLRKKHPQVIIKSHHLLKEIIAEFSKASLEIIPSFFGLKRHIRFILKFFMEARTLVLHEPVEQLFVDILNILLRQLSDVILDYISEAPAAEREERIRIALKFLYKYELLKSQVQWLSDESNIKSIEPTQVPIKSSQDRAPNTVGNGTDAATPITSGPDNIGHTFHDANGDEIVEVQSTDDAANYC